MTPPYGGGSLNYNLPQYDTELYLMVLRTPPSLRTH